MKRRKRRTRAYYKRMMLLVALIGVLLVALVAVSSAVYDKMMAEIPETSQAVSSDSVEEKTESAETKKTTESVKPEKETSEDAATDTVTRETETSAEETAETTQAVTTTQETKRDLASVNYDQVVFVGDSRTLSLGSGGKLEYRIVPESAICATWGGQLVDASAMENTKNAANKMRAKAVFWYGVNDVQMNPMRDNVDNFLGNYATLINEYVKINPNSTIYIVSILNTGVNEKDHYEGQEENIVRYNAALKQYCADCGYIYVDVTSLLVGEEGILDDNIHFSESFYKEKYVPFMVDVLGL